MYSILVFMRWEPEVNRHHNVPSSRGGSHKKINLSLVDMKRHDQFHTWAWNYPPDTVLRLMAIHAARMPGQSLPPSALENVLTFLTERSWKDFYEPDAVLPSDEAVPQTKADYFYEQHIVDEVEDTHMVIGDLLFEERFPWWRGMLLQRALRFFRTQVPQEAMDHFLTERYGSDFSWVKALRADVRSQLRSLLVSASPLTLDSPSQQRVMDILANHKRRLYRQMFEAGG